MQAAEDQQRALEAKAKAERRDMIPGILVVVLVLLVGIAVLASHPLAAPSVDTQYHTPEATPTPALSSDEELLVERLPNSDDQIRAENEQALARLHSAPRAQLVRHHSPR